MQQVTVTLRFDSPFDDYVMEGTDEQIARWVFLWTKVNGEKPLDEYIESWTVENLDETKSDTK
jgi:hypothetical protein